MLPGRAYRPRAKVTTAIGANVVEDRFHAAAAKRALVGADHSVVRIGRKIFVAKLTVRSKFQHISLPSMRIAHGISLGPALRPISNELSLQGHFLTC